MRFTLKGILGVTALVCLLVLSSCETTKTLMEPGSSEESLVIGLAELNLNNWAVAVGSEATGIRHKNLRMTFIDAENNEIVVTVIRSDGLFMSKKFDAGIYMLTKVEYIYEPEGGGRATVGLRPKPKYFVVKPGAVNNLGTLYWYFDVGNRVLDSDYKSDQDDIEELFRSVYPESLWLDYPFNALNN